MTNKLEFQIIFIKNETKQLFSYLDNELIGNEDNCEVFLDKPTDRSGAFTPEVITAIITASSAFMGIIIKGIFDYIQNTNKINAPSFRIKIKNGDNEVEGEFPIGTSQDEIKEYFNSINIAIIKKIEIEKTGSNKA